MDDRKAAIIGEIPRLRRYARALLRDRDSADDLVQDCLERALSRMDNWRTGDNPQRLVADAQRVERESRGSV